jgi:hypothetical protein
MLRQNQVSGPEMTWPTFNLARSNDLASFRAIVAYNVVTDDWVLRLDVKADALQHNIVLATSRAIPLTGKRIEPTDPLVVPNSGIKSGLTVRTDRLQLVEALRELAGKLEQMR